MESRGYTFANAREVVRDVAQFGSALDLGSRGRRFESCHPEPITSLVQLVERRSPKPDAVGSSPTGCDFPFPSSFPSYSFSSYSFSLEKEKVKNKKKGKKKFNSVSQTNGNLPATRA